jgi:hypothetical protein
MSFRWSVSLPAALLLALAGCASPEEIRQAQQAQAEADRYACLEQGFEEGGENFALCRLIMETNRRLDAVATRLAFLENDIDRFDLLAYRPYRWRYW